MLFTKKHNIEREKEKFYGLPFVIENFPFSFSLALNIFFPPAIDFSTARLSKMESFAAIPT